MRIVDAGCGAGRNIYYLLREGYQVFGVDQDPQALADTRGLALLLAPALPAENFRLGSLEAMPFSDAFFDFAIASAVLHFAENERQFKAMVSGLWRVLKPGGILFCRLASKTGMEKQVKRLKGRRYLLPDGSERYLVDEAYLEKLTRELNAELLDPIKSTIVQKQRCMATWVVRKCVP